MCEVSLRNVHECVRCCKNTNSVVKVTCLACKHASSTHISTTNIFFLSDGDSGIWRGGHKVSGFRKCWHCLQRARKQAVPWCGSGQFRTVQVAQPANTSEWHAHLSTVFVFISFWQYKCRTFWLYFMSSSLNAELRWKTIPLMIDCFLCIFRSLFSLSNSEQVSRDPAWFPWVEHVTTHQTDLKPAKEKSQNHYNMKPDDSRSRHHK